MTDEKITAAREALLNRLRLKPGSNSLKAINVLTFEPMLMENVVKLGGLTDTCYSDLNRWWRQGLINKQKTGANSLFSLKTVDDLPTSITSEISSEEESDEFLFRYENDLRDFIAANIGKIQPHGLPLRLYIDDTGRNGIEYPTDVGPIDVLAVDNNGDLVVFELKLSRGADRTVGQALRYMGWVKKHLAAGKKVSGVIAGLTHLNCRDSL